MIGKALKNLLRDCNSKITGKNEKKKRCLKEVNFLSVKVLFSKQNNNDNCA